MSDHTQRAHSEHGASGAYIWTNCHGSVELQRHFPNTENEHSKRGTAAHELAEYCLRGQGDPEHAIGAMRVANGIVIDEPIATGVRAYVDECRSLMAAADLVGIEEQFDLTPFGAPVPMFGTCDFWCYEEAHKRLRIRDYKNGFDVVDPSSPQLLYYALGAVGKLLPLGLEVDEIEVGIVQPNAIGVPAVRTTTVAPARLAEWAEELFEHARATLAPDAPRKAGKWCKWCRAAGNCVTQTDANLATAQVAFAAAVASDATAVVPVETRLLTPEQKSALLFKLDMFEAWAKQARAAATAELQRDAGAIPGWKLVAPGPGRTVWKDEAKAAVTLLLTHDLAEDDIYEPRPLVSPAVARELVAKGLYDAAKARGEKLTKKDATALAKAALADVTDTPPSGSGPSLVPDTDPRPALIPGGAFACLPAPDAAQPAA